jgi:hypothetical protein
MRHQQFKLDARTAFITILSFTFHLHSASSAQAAEALQLRPGVVFNQDTDNGFPITGTHLADSKIEKGKPALIFFGAAGDLNTNRQAKRIVEIYNKMPSKTLKFILVDVDHPLNQESKALIKTFYKGYIPCEILIGHNGKESWSQTGEVQTNLLRRKIDALISQSDTNTAHTEPEEKPEEKLEEKKAESQDQPPAKVEE